MSGHSKWAQIKHKKGIADQKKGRVFSKLARNITIAAKTGPDPDMNPILRSAIEKAQQMNMPKENIERAIERAAGAGEQGLAEMIVEAYGPEGAAILIKAITDNKNRTIQELKHVLGEYGGRLAGEGSVRWLFENCGRIDLGQNQLDKQELELAAIEAGAQDTINEDGKLAILTKPEELEKVKLNLKDSNIIVESAELDFVPKTFLPAPNQEIKEKIEKLFEALDEMDDVQEIYTNIEL